MEITVDVNEEADERKHGLSLLYHTEDLKVGFAGYCSAVLPRSYSFNDPEARTYLMLLLCSTDGWRELYCSSHERRVMQPGSFTVKPSISKSCQTTRGHEAAAARVEFTSVSLQSGSCVLFKF